MYNCCDVNYLKLGDKTLEGGLVVRHGLVRERERFGRHDREAAVTLGILLAKECGSTLKCRVHVCTITGFSIWWVAV